MAEPGVIFVPPLACKLNFVALLIITISIDCSFAKRDFGLVVA
jgi:hypothetical protein